MPANISDLASVESIIAAKGDEQITLPAYTGGATDLAYLRQWIVTIAVDYYGVEASVFDTPSLDASTLLRDLVHRLIYNHDNLETYQSLFTAGQVSDYRTDVAGLFRQENWALCGEIATQLHNVYRAFGYDSIVILNSNGEDGMGTPDSYNDGHVMVEVMLQSGQWIIQDPTYNFVFHDVDGTLIDFAEARSINVFAPSELGIHNSATYTYVGTAGVSGFLAAHEQYLRDNYLGVIYAWYEGGTGTQEARRPVHDWESAHTAAQGGTFADQAEALNAVMATTGNLVERVDALAATQFATGLRLFGSSGAVELVTVQLSDTSYRTIRLDDGTVFEGSFDQIVNAIAHRTSALSAGDQVLFLSPVVFVEADGFVLADFYADRSSADYAELVAARTAAPAERAFLDGTRSVVTFDDDSHDWQWMRQSYVDQNRLSRETILYDDGSTGLVVHDTQNNLAIAWQETRTGTDRQIVEYRWQDDAGPSYSQKFDTAEAEDWAIYKRVLLSNGDLYSDSYIYDDGTRLDTLYDPAGAQPWFTSASRYDALNRLTRTDVDYGLRHVVTDFDVAHAKAWQSIADTRETDGSLVSQAILNDDGTRLVTTYDYNSSKTWLQQSNYYSAAGALLSELIVNDDGSQLKTAYDVAGTKVWSTNASFFAPNGELQSYRMNYDAGGWLSVQFDLEGVRTWSERQERYDASGQLAAYLIVNDDGSRFAINYDLDNFSLWSSWSRYSDQEGNLVNVSYRFDNGTREDIRYDVENAYSWSAQHTYYDGSGTVVRITTVPDPVASAARANLLTAEKAAHDAPATAPVMADYTGGTQDYAYLKAWLVEGMTSFYGVEVAGFDEPTMLSTTLLRDFVNRVLYQRTDMTNYDSLPGNMPAPLSDCAFLFRNTASGSCGYTSLQLYHAYRAFGYDAVWIDSLNGPAGDYSDTHVVTLVKVTDVGDWAVQDAYLNFTLTDGNGEPLTYFEARQLAAGDNSAVTLDDLPGYLNYRYDTSAPPALAASDEANARAGLFGVGYNWVQSIGGLQTSGSLGDIYPVPFASDDPAVAQGGTFGDVAAARATLDQLHAGSTSWQAAMTLLRADHYVSGFAFIAGDAGAVGDAWITLRMADGSFVSFEYGGAGQLAGGFDEILFAAVSDPASLGSVSSDDVLGPVLVAGYTGLFVKSWATQDVASTNAPLTGAFGSKDLSMAGVNALLDSVTFSGADGDVPTHYMLYDTTAGGGYFQRHDGTIVDGTSQVITAAEAEHWSIVLASGGADSTMKVLAHDGNSWSPSLVLGDYSAHGTASALGLIREPYDGSGDNNDSVASMAPPDWF